MPPALLLTRPAGTQLLIAVGVPSAFGLLMGFFLITSKPAYAIGSIIAVIGGLAAGFEHRDAGEGAVRGLIGGLLFGLWILLPKAMLGDDPKGDIPHPEAMLVVVTTLGGLALGAIGGQLRARYIRRRAPPPAAAATAG